MPLPRSCLHPVRVGLVALVLLGTGCTSGGAVPPARTPAPSTPPLAAPTTRIGQGIFRLVCPRLHLNVEVVEGTTAAAMQAGSGHPNPWTVSGSDTSYLGQSASSVLTLVTLTRASAPRVVLRLSLVT